MPIKQIEIPIQLGDAVEHGGVVLAPLFPRRRRAPRTSRSRRRCRSASASPRWTRRARCRSSLATNPLDANVLLYDGEELLGAKQNRILNVTVLVAARRRRGSRSPASRRAAGTRAAPPSIAAHACGHPGAAAAEGRAAARRRRSRAGGRRARSGRRVPRRPGPRRPLADARAGGRLPRAGATSSRGLRGAFPLQPGQSGALWLALGERICLDYVSRPEAFARLYPKLLEGYLLDALTELATRCCKPGSRRVPRRGGSRRPEPATLRGARRGRAPARRGRRRLGARARRRADPAQRVRERRRRGQHAHRPPEPAPLAKALDQRARRHDADGRVGELCQVLVAGHE